MEENKKNKRKNKKSFGTKAVVGTLALVVVAVVAVVALGFRSSYAIPEVENHLPDTFTTKEPDKQITSDTGFFVFPYFTDGDIQVFCLEHMIDYKGNTVFSKGDAIQDYGLLYLMANIYPNAYFAAFANDDLQSWISQTAIWLYLYRVADLENDGEVNENVAETSVHYIKPEDLNRIETARGVMVNDDPSILYTLNATTGGISAGGATADDPLLYTTINNLVTAALANRNTPNKTLSINFDDEVAITQDEKYYQTSEVSVAGAPSDSFNGYELEIVSAPKGTFVVDVNGEEIKDLTNFDATDKFFFRIPVENVTEENKSVKFTVTGSFRTYEGNYYVAEGAQTISSVSTVNNNINKGAEIPLNYTPDVPDTEMSTAQTVYFIGLIILLSGVGIIYANAKPEESK